MGKGRVVAKIGLSETHMPLKQNGRPSFIGWCVPVPVPVSVSLCLPGSSRVVAHPVYIPVPGQPIQPRRPTPRLLNGNGVLHDGVRRTAGDKQPMSVQNCGEAEAGDRKHRRISMEAQMSSIDGCRAMEARRHAVDLGLPRIYQIQALPGRVSAVLTCRGLVQWGGGAGDDGCTLAVAPSCRGSVQA
jgi:hypothetical protein